MTEKIHVVLSTFQRAKLLKLCLESLSKLTIPKNLELQISVLVNGYDHESEHLLHTYQHKLKLSILQSNQRLSFGESRNLLIQNIDSRWIVFVDDDCQLPPDYLINLIQLIERFPDSKGFGGPNLGPQNEGLFEATNSLALGSFWGSGPFVKRYRAISKAQQASGRNLILCNLVLNADLKIKFDRAVNGGEENILISKIIKDGNDLVYSPELYVFHQRRANWRSLIEQITRYGLGRAEMIKSGFTELQNRLLQIATAFAVVGMIYLAASNLNIVTVILSIYFMINCLVVSAYSLFSKVAFHPVLLFYNFLALHFFYPVGVIKGLLKINS